MRINYNRARRGNRGFIFILLFAALIFAPFLKRHFVHDTYLITWFGYGYMYPKLLVLGRVVSYLYLRLFEIVRMPYGAGLTVSVSLSLLFLSLASFGVYLTARESGADGKSGALLAALGSAGIFFNLFTAETLLFFECAVMSFGAFCAVTAARHVLRGRIAVSAFFAVLCVFCYQSEIAYFLPLVLLFPAGHRRKLAAVVIYIFALYANYAFVSLVPASDGRVSGQIDVRGNLSQCVLTLRTFVRDTTGFTPKYLFTLFLLIFAGIIIFDCVKSKTMKPVIRAALSAAALIVCTLLPHAAMARFYAMPRSLVALAGIGGFAVTALSMCVRKRHAVAIALSFTFFIAFIQIDMQINPIANNKLDEAEISVIASEIKRYETENETTVTSVRTAYDKNITYCRNNIRNYADLTVRALAVPWMVTPHINAALGRSYAEESIGTEDFERLFAGRDWTEFSPEQLVFDNGILYFCGY